jgi:hypothetical protein
MKDLRENIAFVFVPLKLSACLLYRNSVALYWSVLTTLYSQLTIIIISSIKLFTHVGYIITSELTDDAGSVKRCGDFVGQVNDTGCYFRKLD